MPIVFLSSTVVDLRDLRSALKFWFEEFGYEVRASETSDFPRPLDRQAAEAALATIDGSDYYVLIVGERRGSTFPGRNMSVTHAELLEAQRLYSSTGLPRLLTFVRRQLVDLVGAGVRPQQISEEDWNGMTAILARAREPSLPNWVNEFDSFKDMVDVLRATLKMTGPLRRRGLEASLLREIRTNTRNLMHKEREGAFWPPPRFMEPNMVPRVTRADLDGDMALTRTQASNVLEYNLETVGTSERIVTIALDSAIQSGEFLDFQPATAALLVGPFQDGLLQLREQIERLRGVTKVIEQQIAQLNRLSLRGNQVQQFAVSGMFIALLQSHANIYLNILVLNGAVAKFLAGVEATFRLPTLRHYSPRADVAEAIEATRLTEADVDISLGLRPPPDPPAGMPHGE